MKISIVMVVRNRRATIRRALDSLVSQRHIDRELIVIDGASTDGTLEIIGEYSSHIGTLVSEPDEGAYDALNKGLKLATGDVIGCLHSDDQFADDMALSRVDSALTQTGAQVAYGDLVYVLQDDSASVLRYWQAGPYSRARLKRGWMPPHPTFYARRSLYQRHGMFDTRYTIAADYDSMLRMLLNGQTTCTYIPQVQIRMAAGGLSNRSLRNIVKKSHEDFRIIKQHGLGGVGTLIYKNVSKLGQFVARASPTA